MPEQFRELNSSLVTKQLHQRSSTPFTSFLESGKSSFGISILPISYAISKHIHTKTLHSQTMGKDYTHMASRFCFCTVTLFSIIPYKQFEALYMDIQLSTNPRLISQVVTKIKGVFINNHICQHELISSARPCTHSTCETSVIRWGCLEAYPLTTSFKRLHQIHLVTNKTTGFHPWH